MVENLDEAVANSNGLGTTALTRRAALFGLGVSLIVASGPRAQAAQLPTREDLEDYMLFLWSEHRRVADELGVEPHDFMVMHRRGGKGRYDRACTDPASVRALAVLSLSGFGGAA